MNLATAATALSQDTGIQDVLETWADEWMYLPPTLNEGGSLQEDGQKKGPKESVEIRLRKMAESLSTNKDEDMGVVQSSDIQALSTILESLPV